MLLMAKYVKRGKAKTLRTTVGKVQKEGKPETLVKG